MVLSWVPNTLRYPNPLLRGILAATVALLLLLLYVPPLRDFFQLASPGIGLLALASGVGLASVLWYEGVKGWKRRRTLAP